MEFEICKAEESDLEEIMKVVNEAYAVEFDNPQSHKRTPRFGSIQSTKEFLPNFWILKSKNKNETGNGKIVGCAHAKVVGDVVKIGPVAVKVGFQGQGIGSKLLDFVEDLAPICRMGVISFRSDLFSFYANRGYAEMSREPISNLIPAQVLQRTDVQMVYLEKRRN